jgi:hypothetical protein
MSRHVTSYRSRTPNKAYQNLPLFAYGLIYATWLLKVIPLFRLGLAEGPNMIQVLSIGALKLYSIWFHKISKKCGKTCISIKIVLTICIAVREEHGCTVGVYIIFGFLFWLFYSFSFNYVLFYFTSSRSCSGNFWRTVKAQEDSGWREYSYTNLVSF